MIWEPFVLALVLGLLVSAGLYFAYLWPQVEPSPDPSPSPSPDPDPKPETTEPAEVSPTP